ncbi:MAG: nuclear transport factor 2 family protein [Terriglobales bacterium]
MKLPTIVVAVFALIATTFAQAPATGQMATIPVATFTNLENQLHSAIGAGNEQRAAALLTGDFVEWSPQPPGAPISRGQWLNGNRDLGQARLWQMAVKTLDDHAIASFVLIAGNKAFFVVDLWQKHGSDWLLQQRYRAPVDPASYRNPSGPTVKY